MKTLSYVLVRWWWDRHALLTTVTILKVSIICKLISLCLIHLATLLNIHVQIYVWIHIHIHIYMCVCVYIYTHLHIAQEWNFKHPELWSPAQVWSHTCHLLVCDSKEVAKYLSASAYNYKIRIITDLLRLW